MTKSASAEQREAARIREEYARRAERLPADFYSVSRPHALFHYTQRVRVVVRTLVKAGFFPLDRFEILEVGCGPGNWLVDFESWGARRENLYGIELDPTRADAARRRLSLPSGPADANIKTGDASKLPWDDACFDLVLQSTVFTSVLDESVRRQIAREMLRVLRPDGAILWYDFSYDNPNNPAVRGVRKAEIRSLFPGCRVELERLTLAPPVARRLVKISWIGAAMLEKAGLLNTHYLGLIRRE